MVDSNGKSDNTTGSDGKSKALVPAAPAAAPARTALAPYERNLKALVTMYDESKFNLLVPKMAMSDMPDGFRFVATRIDISPEVDDGEVYPIKGGNGKLGIGKSKLNQIASALGITWKSSRRIGDQSHPHYVEWQAVAEMTLPDGTPHTEVSSKTVDMRADIGDGTPGADLQEITATASGKDRNPSAEIMRVRKDIQSLAETKAKNRAIRACAGLQTSYTKAQLAKPFVAVKMAVDPRNPMASQMLMANMTGVAGLLYGGPQAPHPRVIDASFDETEPGPADTATAAAGDEAAGGVDGSPSSAASEPAEPEPGPMPPMDEPDPAPPPALTDKERMAALDKIWKRVAKAGMAQKAWGAWVKTNTGKGRTAQITREDLQQLETAAEAYAEANGGGQ